jgi:hypothetical protein
MGIGRDVYTRRVLRDQVALGAADKTGETLALACAAAYEVDVDAEGTRRSS